MIVPVGLILGLIAMFAVWDQRLRSDRDQTAGHDVKPRVGVRARLLGATSAFALGVAFCFATYRLQHPYVWGTVMSPRLIVSIPFAGLAVLIAFGLRRSASVVGWIALAALTVLAFAAAGGRWFGGTPEAAVDLQVFYGAIILVHLVGHSLGETRTPLKANRAIALSIGTALLVFTGIALLPIRTEGWDSETANALALGIAFAAPFWLSSVFALVQLALGRAKYRAAAYMWFGSALLGLFMLFVALGISHLEIE
jgi:hypothetical protein